jgi:WD40 repeat protein
VAVLKGHTNPILSARFSPDGRRMVTTSMDRSARLWDTATGKELHLLKSPLCRFSFAVFSPDGRRVLTTHSGMDGTLVWDPAGAWRVEGAVPPRQDCAGRIWDADTGNELVVLHWPHEIDLGGSRFLAEGGVGRGAFSPDGRSVLTAGRDSISAGSGHTGLSIPLIWDAATGGFVRVLKPAVREEGSKWDRDYAATFSRDGRHLVTVQEDNTARIWDTATWTELAALPGHEGTVVAATFSPDGRRVLTASNDRTARIWNPALDPESAAQKGLWPDAWLAGFSGDGRRLVTISSRAEKIATIWDVATGRVVARLEGPARRIHCASLSADGLKAVTGSDDGAAYLWDAATGKQLAVLGGNDTNDMEVVFAEFSPDDRLVVTATNRGKEARLWEVATGKELATLKGDETHPIRSVTFTPDSRWVLTRGYGPWGGVMTANDVIACIWEVASGNKLVTLKDEARRIIGSCSSATFSPDGRRVLSCGGNNSGANIWDATTGKLLATLGTDQFGTAVFSPDGQQVLTVHQGPTVRLWDVAAGKELLTLPPQEGLVRSAAFSPDGKLVLTASNTAAHIWDAGTGKEIVTLKEPDYAIGSARFSPDGKWVLAMMGYGSDKVPPTMPQWKARLWPVDLLSAAQARKPRDLTPEERKQFKIGSTEQGTESAAR